MIAFCKEMYPILGNPKLADKFILYDENEILEHIKNCETCKKTLNHFYESKSKNIPFAAKMLMDSFIKKSL